MKIELANKFDVPELIEMIKRYRDNAPVEQFKFLNDEEHMSKVLSHILVGRGLIVVAKHNDKIIGTIISFIDQSLWDDNLLVLKEMAYWVDPEHRGSTAGYKLLVKYNELAQKLKNDGRISMWTISKMITSPNLDYQRFGYRKIEETWVMGE